MDSTNGVYPQFYGWRCLAGRDIGTVGTEPKVSTSYKNRVGTGITGRDS